MLGVKGVVIIIVHARHNNGALWSQCSLQSQYQAKRPIFNWLYL